MGASGVSDNLDADRNREAWHCLALIHGYNELVKTTDDLASKVYFRLVRDHFEEEVAKLGTKINRGDQGNVVLELTSKPPHIIFHGRDIELMRAAVAAFDKAQAPECTGTSASWCPVCGDCKCPRSESGETDLNDESCPLHSVRSKHAELTPIPTSCGRAPPYGCPGCGAMSCIHVDDRGRLRPREGGA